ncbi:MAG: diguanylate cyclase [Sulfuricurvum sp.]
MRPAFVLAWLMIFASSMTGTNVNTVHLSAKEQVYLNQKKVVTMCVDPDWEPFEIINADRKHEGIAADLISLAARRAGVNIKLLPTATWEETLEKSKSGQCDILSFVNQTPDREKWLIFTEPLLSDPNILITREEHPFIGDIRALDGERIAIPAGTAMLERFSKDFPNLIFIPVETEAHAVELVSERKADLTVRSLIVAAYTIKKEGLFNLKISGQPLGYENNLKIGVLKNEPILRDILDKGIATITPIEREAIVNKHVGVIVHEGLDRKTVMELVGLVLFIAAFFLWRYYELKRYNAKLFELSMTDKLTGLFNRMKIDEKLEEERKRVSRYQKYPCSVMMVDIDFFKSINDTYGHLEGDRILKEIALLMRSSFRETDAIGRWGGEEFIIIFPNTDAEEARIAAENFRINVQKNLSTPERSVTVSIGVGMFRSDDSVDELIQRIDNGLYDAKENGRNAVVLT